MDFTKPQTQLGECKKYHALSQILYLEIIPEIKQKSSLLSYNGKNKGQGKTGEALGKRRSLRNRKGRGQKTGGNERE